MNDSVPDSALATGERTPSFIQVYREDQATALEELHQGLAAPQPFIAPKFLYDALGSRLFEAITELPEYYPTRTEAMIFDAHAAAMGTTIVTAIGAVGSLVDLGAAACVKGLRLIGLLRPASYVAVDISVEFLRTGLARVQREHPRLDVTGVGLDFSAALNLPAFCVQDPPVFFYAGSSIGNFTPEQAVHFLAGVREQARGGGLLIGVDLVKDSDLLVPAYDDALGVTAAFNLNLLLHLNRLLGADFAVRDWRHVALFNTEHSRIEMHLEARHSLTVHWTGAERHFPQGQRLHTENSYKYGTDSFAALLRSAGFTSTQHWTDPNRWFAVFWASA
ncbi:MAG: L-histidine N(alpha)-methyltransferase [Burkholderiaceae bacterium]